MVVIGSGDDYFRNFTDDKISTNVIRKEDNGVVFNMKNKNDQMQYAVKVVNPCSTFDKFWENIMISVNQSQIKHRNFLKIYEIYAWQSEYLFHIRIVSEMYDESLEEKMKNLNFFTHKDSNKFFYQLISGLSFLRNNLDLSHGNLIPKNIFFDDQNTAKITNIRSFFKVEEEEDVFFF